MGLVVADTHYVSLSGTNNSPYTNGWADAATNIQWAINVATNGDTVLISNGTYILTNTITIVPTKAIMLRSVNGRDYTTMQMDLTWGSNRCIYLSTTGTIDGFTIANGCTEGVNGGGGVYMTTGTIQNCTVVSNRLTGTANGNWGGGIYCYHGLVSNCLVTCNTSGYSGGGVFLDSATMRDCVISSNNTVSTAGNAGGGGVYMSGISQITDCVVSNNAGSGFASGLAFNDGSIAYASNCIITDNLGPSYGFRVISSSTAEYCVVKNNGGLGSQVGACQVYGILRNSVIHDNNKTAYNVSAYGLVVQSGGLVENCVISNNYGQNYGTGVRMRGGTLRNCLIIANTNSSGNSAAGVYSALNGITMVQNCTIAGNARGMSFSTAEGAATNLVINTIVYSNTVDITDNGTVNLFTNCNVGVTVSGANNINTNPAWVDPGNYNFRLTSRSPCVNTGTNQTWMTNAFDLDGRTRIRYGTVDMGAYEYIHAGTIFTIR